MVKSFFPPSVTSTRISVVVGLAYLIGIGDLNPPSGSGARTPGSISFVPLLNAPHRARLEYLGSLSSTRSQEDEITVEGRGDMEPAVAKDTTARSDLVESARTSTGSDKREPDRGWDRGEFDDIQGGASDAIFGAELNRSSDDELIGKWPEPFIEEDVHDQRSDEHFKVTRDFDGAGAGGKFEDEVGKLEGSVHLQVTIECQAIFRVQARAPSGLDRRSGPCLPRSSRHPGRLYGRTSSQ